MCRGRSGSEAMFTLFYRPSGCYPTDPLRSSASATGFDPVFTPHQ